MLICSMAGPDLYQRGEEAIALGFAFSRCHDSLPAWCFLQANQLKMLLRNVGFPWLSWQWEVLDHFCAWHQKGFWFFS